VSPDLLNAIHLLKQIGTNPKEIDRIVRKLASLQPGTEIAERQITAFASEVLLFHNATRSVLGIADSFITFPAK
jgi:hypothetical protein